MAKHRETTAQETPSGQPEETTAQEGAPSITSEAPAVPVPEEIAQVSDAAKTKDDSSATDENGNELQGESPEAPYGLKADGTPAKKRGRKPISASDEADKQRARLRSVTPGKPVQKKVQEVNVTALAVVNYQAMGEAVASMFFSTGIMVFGAEWEPDKQEGEHLAVAGAFRDYFKATNMRDLPPGFALCFVLGVYSLKRAAKPTIKSKLALFGAWVKSKMPKRRGYVSEA